MRIKKSKSKIKLPLKPKEAKAVREFQEDVFKKFGSQVLNMKLYGSKARGDSGRYLYKLCRAMLLI